jgi:hypothetical protein
VITDFFFRDKIKNRFIAVDLFICIYFELYAFYHLVLQPKKNVWVLGLTSELVNLTILAEQNLSHKKSEVKSQKRDTNTLREPRKVHILYRKRKATTYYGCQLENFATKKKLSVI